MPDNNPPPARPPSGAATGGAAGQGMLHVVGGGIAGLAAAVMAVDAGRPVTLHEAAAQAGGRCRSFHDKVVDRVIDNGNHLVLGGNRAVFDYLARIGAEDAFAAMARPEFPFVDLHSGKRWAVRPNAGPLPWWVLAAGRRPPDSTAADHLAAFKLRRARPDATVADCLDTSRPLFETLWQPLSRAVLNTDATEASARLMWTMLSETLLKGAAASRPHVAREGLTAALVDPALAKLTAADAEVRFGARLRAIDTGIAPGIAPGIKRATALDFGDEIVALGARDDVILALPPWEIGDIAPRIEIPTEFRAIVNVHFRCDDRPSLPAASLPAASLPGGSSVLGVIGGSAQWIFQRGDILSVTVSDAGPLADQPAAAIAQSIWRETAIALGRVETALPPYRVIKEQRATMAQTPAQILRRPDPATPWGNVFLAGDWTNTGVPATIESAVRSGYRAAALTARS